MSWIQKLYETYNNCQSAIGYSGEEGERPLLPMCHISAQAQIEIVINGEGDFQRARVITNQKSDAITIIPCTEGSGSRSGKKPECHPLCDNLQYIAEDYTKYGGTVTSGFSSDPQEPYRNYIEILTKWCESEFPHPKAKAVLQYVRKGKVVQDLADYRVLIIGQDGKLLKKNEAKESKNTSSIFTVTNSQEDAFVRWVVESPGDLETAVWKDKTVWKSWSDYYLSTREKGPICFVLGTEAVLTDNHPKYIRTKGDGAKLISSNDKSGLTYRGRFLTNDQACSVSLEVSQKAHDALLWLISRQGKTFCVKGDNGRKEPGLSIVAWATTDKKVLQPTDDPLDILSSELPDDYPKHPFTAQDFAIRLRNKILGYASTLGNVKSIQIMALDSASKGRMAITYYQEHDISDYLDRINKWHEECAWIHRYRSPKIQDADSNKTHLFYTFTGAPAPTDVAEAAYGKKVDDRLRQITVLRILPCIVEGQQIPYDLVESTVRRASKRVGIKSSDENVDWNKTLTIACALFRKYNSKEKYDMTLEEDRTTRDYLYGRLLAIADRLEEVALYKAKEKRATNAARYMQQFSQHPYRTWNQIHSSLTPYIVRLGGAYYYKKLIAEISCLFNSEDFVNDKPLSGEYLLGYYCQKQKLTEKKSDKEYDDANDDDNE